MAHLVVLLCFCIAKRTVGYKDAFANGKIFVEMENSMQNEKEQKIRLLRILFFISPFLAGLYHELTCGLFSACLVIWLFLYGRKKQIDLWNNTAALAVLIFFLAYLITPLWAVDQGLSVWGVAKALPVLLFSVCLMQLERTERQVILCDLPLMGCIMTAASCVLQLVPSLSDYLMINGRLSGFFQYPNTFACFLLLGLEVLVFDERHNKKIKIAEAMLLAFGFFQAGSRTALIIAIAALATCLILRTNKGSALLLVSGILAGFLANICVASIATHSSLEHMLNISTDASTFLGRLLYWKDALPVIIKHPFGLGYLGYYFAQGTFQTGVYSVRWIHNDLLQFLLDIGWIPAVICLLAIWRTFRSRNIPPWQKIVMLTLLAHAFCDFDLQYVSMFLILLLTLDWESGKRTILKCNRFFAGASAVAVIASLWVGSSSLMTTVGRDAAAVRIYPWNTFSQLQLLTEDTDIIAFAERSAQIIRHNSYSAVAWDAQAIVAQQQGDYSAVVYAKRKAISCNKYDLAEYTDYLDKLLAGAEQYNQAGQMENAQLCLQEAQQIPLYLADVQAKTSALAWKITDKPQLELPQEYMNKLAALRK